MLTPFVTHESGLSAGPARTAPQRQATAILPLADGSAIVAPGMNFLFFAGGSAIHGMEIAVHSLMAGLRARGHRSTAIVNGWNNGDYPRRLWQAGLDYYEADLGRLYLRRPRWTYHTLRAMPAAIRELRAIAATVRPDWLIFSDPQLLLWSAWTLPPAQRALYLHSRPESLPFHLAGAVARRHVHRVVSVSAFIADCVGRTPLRTVPGAVVHNGIEMPRTFGPLRESFPDSPPGGMGPVQVGIVGAVAPQKQHLVLLAAIAQLRQRLPAGAFRLHVIGRALGRFPRAVEAEVAALGLADLVVRAGFVEDRDSIYRDLDIVVAPALGEGFGLTVVEAGAYGRPVVAARSGALPEIVQHDRTGLLFEAGSAEGLARALERLVRDEALRRRMGEAARAWVTGRFTVDRMTDGFLAALAAAPP